MARKGLMFAGLAAVLQVSCASAQIRLEGLERLYFERVAGPGGRLPASARVAPFLPETLPQPGFAATAPDEMESDDDLTVQDFELPAQSSTRRLWVREIVDHSHPRIAELWWALYDGGRRSDVWSFTAYPTRTDDKMLSNYYLGEVSMPSKDIVIFRVEGQMFRPGGAWWMVGKEWIFAVGGNSISLNRVRNVFGFFHSYDLGEEPPTLGVSTEQESGGRFEVRKMDPVPESTLQACGFRDPTADEDGDFSWASLEKVARCITGKPGAEVTFRELNAPSFVERNP